MPVPLFNFDDSIRQLYTDGIDTLIFYIGRPCKLIFDGVRGPCPNCVVDPAANRSTGIYNGTGEYPFTIPPCPVCRGSGVDPATLERAEVRTFLIERNIKPNAVYPANLTRPGGIARIKGHIDDLPLVIQCKSIVLDYQNAEYLSDRYVKLDEPTPQGSIVAGKYFQAHLQRSEQ